jgi:hypothetical protein
MRAEVAGKLGTCVGSFPPLDDPRPAAPPMRLASQRSISVVRVSSRSRPGRADIYTNHHVGCLDHRYRLQTRLQFQFLGGFIGD